MRARASLMFLILAGACQPGPSASSTAPLTTSESASEPELVAFEPRAEFRLSSADGRERGFDWSAASNLVTCQYSPEPARGDYLWIRLGETAEQNGDAGVRLDIDVCRLAQVRESLATMPAGQHGSHCAETPGFAIWWHEAEAAFNTGTELADDCRLELDYAAETKILRGEFDCAGLRSAESSDTSPGPELTLVAGRFACLVEVPPPSS